jgi:archaellum component FlaF (FlaF/FlaG flagellin family)
MKKIFILFIGVLIFFSACNSGSVSNYKQTGDAINCYIKANNYDGVESTTWLNKSTQASFDCTLDEYVHGYVVFVLKDSEGNVVLNDTIIKGGKLLIPSDVSDTGYTGEWKINFYMNDFNGKFKTTVYPHNN